MKRNGALAPRVVRRNMNVKGRRENARQIPPMPLMVNAITPMLNTKAANECAVTIRRIAREEIVTSEVWKVMPSVSEK